MDTVLSTLVNAETGSVSRRIFADETIYRQELERIFARTWLFLCHESQLAAAGDYFATYMGEDPIIVCRGRDGVIRAFLNSCRHRGMKVCREPAGNARAFTCIYHGWTYDDSGRLVSVPYEEQAYGEPVDRDGRSLTRVPRLESYGGFVFGCWDEEVEALDTWLGDLRFYLDVFIERSLGGLEALSGVQRYRCDGNWKLPADNFAGDDYHVPWTHGSYLKLGVVSPRYAEAQAYTVAFPYGHGIGDIHLDGEPLAADREFAQRFGPEAADYVEAVYARAAERLGEPRDRVAAFGHGNIFPNFSLNDFSALWPVGIYLWHPRGPREMEVWQWCLVDRDAPASVREAAMGLFTQVQSVAGAFGQDDSENFEQASAATRGAVAQRQDFDYTMGLGKPFDDAAAQVLPGEVGPHFSEHCQRGFYREWHRLMTGGES